MFNPSGSSNSQLVPENADLNSIKSVPLVMRLFLACPPMRRFV